MYSIDRRHEMKYQGNSPKQLETIYLEKSAGIEEKLVSLLEMIEATKKADYPITWGEVGSLGYLNVELENLVKFIGS